MLGRVLSLVAAFLIACASTGAHGYARPLQPETAHRGFATAAEAAHRAQAHVTPEAASENSPAIAEASDGRRFYAKARYYGAGRGGFLSVDPWDGDPSSPVSLNKYLYGYANPGVYVDPDGRITLLADLQRWFDQQSANSLAVARSFDAAQADAPLYARPGLAVGWAVGGIGYLTGAAASSVVAGANAGANAVVVAADEAGGALGSENVFTPLAGEARSEIGAFVEQTGPAALALQADPVGIGAAATAGLVTGYADQINRAAAGDARAQFDLAAELTPRRFGERVGGAVLRAADDAKVGAPRPVTLGEGADGEPALRMVQEPGRSVQAAGADSTAGMAPSRLRDPTTGRFVADPANPPSPYVFTDAQRRAAWKQIAQDPNSPLTEAQRQQVKERGWRGPQQLNAVTGEIETMELSHEPTPLRDGGTIVVPRWPEEHAALDPHRKLKQQ
jgi:RHS repeat-associated protein